MKLIILLSLAALWGLAPFYMDLGPIWVRWMHATSSLYIAVYMIAKYLEGRKE